MRKELATIAVDGERGRAVLGMIQVSTVQEVLWWISHPHLTLYYT